MYAHYPPSRSFASVRKCAAAIAALHGKVDVLINNAGLMDVPYSKTAVRSLPYITFLCCRLSPSVALFVALSARHTLLPLA